MREAWRDYIAALLGLALVGAPTRADDAEVATDAEVAEASAEHGGEADHGAHGDGHAADAHGESTPDPLATDPDLALWTLLVFVAMLTILTQVAWKPIMEALKAREENIGGAIDAAQGKLAEAERVLAEHKAELAGAADQVRALLEEARRDADATIAEAKAEAKREFEAERLRAQRDIEQARSAAVRSLAEQTAGLAIDLAGKVVAKDISADRQKEIVHEALSRFGGAKPN